MLDAVLLALMSARVAFCMDPRAMSANESCPTPKFSVLPALLPVLLALMVLPSNVMAEAPLTSPDVVTLTEPDTSE